MSEIEAFQLPRDDWYDADGRIYKDAIIENLNAIESKLLELQKLDAFNVEIPDLNTLVYPDSTLESDDNCIVNLRSFINIMHLVNYPIEVQISNKTIKTLSYWDSSYKYVTIKDKSFNDITTDAPYIVLNPENKTVVSSNTPAVEGSVLIGVFDGNSIISIHSMPKMRLNLMYLLANNMQKDVITRSVSRPADAWNNISSPYNSKRTIITSYGESGQPTTSNTVSDYGREV